MNCHDVLVYIVTAKQVVPWWCQLEATYGIHLPIMVDNDQ